MGETPLRVSGTGAVTSVGFDAVSSAAAMRCRLNRFEEIEPASVRLPLIAAAVHDEHCAEGTDPAARLGRWMAEAAAQACAGQGLVSQHVPVLACLMSPARPGHPLGWSQGIVHEFVRRHGRPHARSRTFAGDSLAIVEALDAAHRLLHGEGHDAVLLAAADTWLLEDTLQALVRDGRCMCEDKPDGMIPGEAAAALLLTRADETDTGDVEALYIGGWAVAEEAARLDNELPNLAAGLCAALRGAVAQAGQDASDTDLVLAELMPEPFYLDEACTAAVRTFQGCVRAPETWLTAESLGATGASAPLLAACWLHEAHTRDYHPGFNSMWHAAVDDGRRGAVAFTWL